MKVLTICNAPANESMGSGYGIVNYARQLRRLGCEVELHDYDGAALFPKAAKGRGYRLALGMLFLALRRLRREKWDVVEFWGGEAWLATTVLSRLPGRGFLIVQHSNGIEPHAFEVMAEVTGYANFAGTAPRWYQRDNRRLLETAFRRCDALVTLSHYDRDYALRESYLPPGRVLAIETPLAPAFLGLPLPENPGKRLGFCGMWIRRKGTEAMVADVTRILREHPEWTFRVVGPGPGADPRADFPDDVRPRVEVTGFLADKAALLRAYREIDILLVPSIYESFGIVASEAMAAGCVVVMGATGFGAALRHGEEAWLLPRPASPFLYEALRTLVGDPALRETLRRNGHRRVQGLAWEAAGETLAAQYRRWLAEFREHGAR